LVTFFDLISFFGVASLFAWLGYGPLLSEQKASTGLGTLTDYFMFSFWFYAISAAFDYLHDLPHLEGSYVVAYHFWTGIVVAGAFVLRTETLLVASYYVREFGKTLFTKTDIPPFSFVMEITYLLTFGGLSSAVGLLTSISYVGYSTFTLLFVASCYYGYKYARSWRKPDVKAKKGMTFPIVFTVLWLIISIVMFALFGWPI
jgi:hypothetical protein